MQPTNTPRAINPKSTTPRRIALAVTGVIVLGSLFAAAKPTTTESQPPVMSKKAEQAVIELVSLVEAALGDPYGDCKYCHEHFRMTASTIRRMQWENEALRDEIHRLQRRTCHPG